MRLPLPPLAAAICTRDENQLPVKVQHRNRYMELAGLTRDFVRVRYVQGEATHTARQTSADMIMLSSGGDTNLKEKALGHAGIYGHNAL